MALSCWPELSLADRPTVDKMVLKIHLLYILVRKHKTQFLNLIPQVMCEQLRSCWGLTKTPFVVILNTWEMMSVINTHICSKYKYSWFYSMQIKRNPHIILDLNQVNETRP